MWTAIIDVTVCPLQVFKMPSGEFDKVATRFSLPVRAVAFSPSGTSIAAAGDDDGIKLVNIADSKVCNISARPRASANGMFPFLLQDHQEGLESWCLKVLVAL